MTGGVRYPATLIRWLDASEDGECEKPTSARGPVERTMLGWLVKDLPSSVHFMTEVAKWHGSKTEHTVFVIPRSMVLETRALHE